MKPVCPSRKEGQKLVAAFYVSLKKRTDEKLIKAHYRAVKIGIMGVPAQAVYVPALRNLLKDRFDKDFIAVEEGVLDLG